MTFSGNKYHLLQYPLFFYTNIQNTNYETGKEAQKHDPSSKERLVRDFPGGPVVKTLHFYCRGCGFDPWLGN